MTQRGATMARARITEFCPPLSGTPWPSVKVLRPRYGGSVPDDDLGVGGDGLLEGGGVVLAEVEHGPLAAVQDDLPDEVVDVGVARLEELPRDVPRLEDAAADDAVQADAVDDEPVEALDDRVAALEAEEDDVAAAPDRVDGVVHARVDARHLERD